MKKLKMQTKTKAIITTLIGLALILGVGVTATAAKPPKLTVRLDRTIVSTTYEKGSEAEMIGVALTASSGPVIVKTLSFHMIADDDASFSTVENDVTVADYITNCSLTNTRGSVIAGPEAISDHELIFEGLAIGIGRDRTQSYKVVCNLANLETMSGNNDIYALTMTSDSDVTVETTSGPVLTGRNLDIGGITDPGINVNGRNVAITVKNPDTLTFVFNGPSSDDIEIDGDDVVFMEFILVTESWVEIKDFDVIVEDNSEDNDDNDDSGLKQIDEVANLTDICIREADGSVWMGPEEIGGSDAASDSSQTLTFDDYQVLDAGDSLELFITADIDANAPADEDWHVEIDMSTVTAENSGGDELIPATDIIPMVDIVGFEFTTIAASLDVSISSTPAAGATYVKGASDVSVVGFTFGAGAASDMHVSELTLSSQGDGDGVFSAGDIAEPDTDLEVSDYVSSCSLYDGVTGSLVDGPESADDDEVFSFDSFDWTVNAGETSKLLVKCNFNNIDTNGGNDDAYVFYIDAAADVTAEDEDENEIDITLNDGNGDDDADDVDVIITNNGGITVTLASDSATSTIILGSSTGVSVAKYKFTATDEDFVVNKVTFLNCIGYNEDDECADVGEDAGDDNAVATVKVSYTNSDGTTETKSGYFSDNSAIFSGMDLFVPADENRYLTVTVDTYVVSSTGAASGSIIQLNFDTETAAAEFEAVGQSSGETINEGETTCPDSVAANDMTLYKTKPTISLSSGSPFGAGIPGLNEVFRFNIAADSRGYVTLNEVTFKMTSTDNTTGGTEWNTCDITGGTIGIDEPNLSFYDISDMSTALDIDADWTLYDSSDGSVCTEDTDVIDYIVLDLTTADVIGAGTTVTYSLYMDTTGASSANDDSLRIDLDANTNSASGTSAHTGTDGTINWEDDSSATDLYASLVKTLPVNGGTITY